MPPPNQGAGTEPPPDASPAPDDAAVQPDGPSGTDDAAPAVVPIHCVDVTCMSPVELCCVVPDHYRNNNMYTCVGSTSSCNDQFGIPVHCTSNSQCSTGEYCCGTKTNHNTYTDVSCQPQPCNSGNGQGPTQFQFCDPQGPRECDGNTRCQPSNALNGFNVCY
jgi:hypothetical protein